jgi:Vitamin B6 photo-protection and homoeostasis
MRKKLLVVRDHGSFVSADHKHGQGWMPLDWWRRCTDTVVGLMLPHGYPYSVSTDYMEYSLWRGVQGIASQVSAVLSTQVSSLPSFLPSVTPPVLYDIPITIVTPSIIVFNPK